MARKKSPKRGNKRRSSWRRFRLALGAAVLVMAVVHSAVSVWFVHHPRQWLDERRKGMPGFLYTPLLRVGNSVGDLTDAFGLTGHDVVYEFDQDPPSGQIHFAGAPIRTGSPAPNDIQVLNRGEFEIGWSPSLCHPVWCAYHVPKSAVHEAGKRPDFRKDASARNAPNPSAYSGTHYDRGHMVPNYAIVTRFGEAMQKKTFLTSNIVPQTAALNRGVWRDLEHRIAEFWSRRYGEIWVIVGCYGSNAAKRLPGSDVDVPENFYMVVVCQQGLDLMAFAVDLPQTVGWNDYAARSLITIDELEAKTGLDFLPELPEFISAPLEAELPTRLWPVNFADVFRQLASRYSY